MKKVYNFLDLFYFSTIFVENSTFFKGIYCKTSNIDKLK